VIAGMGVICLGAMMAVLLSGGHERNPAEVRVGAEVRWVGFAVLLAIQVCALWSMWRYASLLRITMQCLNSQASTAPQTQTRETEDTDQPLF
jgi:endonuclease/exonuclease/phosphatase (EEP) superfamily protein YafD